MPFKVWPMNRCSPGGGLIDICDRAQVFEHAGPLPHPQQDKVTRRRGFLLELKAGGRVKPELARGLCQP
jgi:hypothetical protein